MFLESRAKLFVASAREVRPPGGKAASLLTQQVFDASRRSEFSPAFQSWGNVSLTVRVALATFELRPSSAVADATRRSG